MKMNKILLLSIIAWCFGFIPLSHAQKVVIKSGSPAYLKSLSGIGLEFTYDNMMAGKLKEADYVARKVQEYNAEEPGKGDQWSKNWVSDRQAKYQPRFQDGFNNYLMLSGVDFKAIPNAGGKYRMVVHTLSTEPGSDVKSAGKTASINVEVAFIDEAGAEFASVMITNCPGNDNMELDYNTGARIQEAYANAGRALAAFLLKEAFGK